MVVFGTRPEGLKMAPLVQRLAASSLLRPVVCVTSQHREMLADVMQLFSLHADFDLDVMSPNQSLGQLTARILSRLEPLLLTERPAAILVQGDTTTTFCAALAGFYAGIRVGHVEAGLRTGDLQNPFPEEMNRVCTSRLAAWHFAATEQNRQNLLSEGVASERIFVTGNTVIDALLQMSKRIDEGAVKEETKALLQRFCRPLALVTGHRRESFGRPMEEVCRALRRLAEKHSEVDFVFPVHLNPQVQQPVHAILSDLENMHLIKPLGYEAFVALMKRAVLVITDSGGIQEEAPSLGKPVLVTRYQTERQESLGPMVELVGTSEERIIIAAERWLAAAKTSSREQHDDGGKRLQPQFPYGRGDAAEKIVAVLERELV